MAHLQETQQETAENQINWLPRTKLRPPRLSGDIIGRSRLHAQLGLAFQTSKLILISSPAGSGKTTLTADFVASNSIPHAWLRLNQEENDPQTFVTSIVAALQTLDPTLGKAALQLLAATNDPAAGLQRSVSLLINDILEKELLPFALVLDDYHAIENETIHTAIDYLLEQMPPALRLIITTRYDPPLALAKLRMRGQLSEIRLHQLRFAEDETKIYLAEQVGFALSADQLHTLHLRTDGWIAGVRLLALTLGKIEAPADRDTFINQFSQSNRLVFELLAEEVLAQQPTDIRDFLLKTAILDELRPALCVAVTENENAPALLEDIYQRNLFMTATDPYDSAETTYRYHDLFAGFLCKELQKRTDIDRATLHMRAANGSTSAERKIYHYLLAEAWDEAIAHIVATGKEQSSHGYISKQVIDWISQLPPNSSQTYYWLDLIEAGYANQRGEKDKTERSGNRALAAARANQDIAAEFEALWLIRFYAEEPGDGRAAEIVDKHPELLPTTRRIQVLMGRAWSKLSQDDWDEAQVYFYQFLEAVRPDKVKYGTFTSQHIGPQWLFVDDGMRLLEEFDRDGLNSGEDDMLQLGGCYRKGWICFLRGELEAAEEHFQRGQTILNRYGTFAFTNLVYLWLQVSIFLAHSRLNQIETIVRSVENQTEMPATQRGNLPYFWFAQWRAYWLRDQIDEAKKISAKVDQAGSPITRANHPTVSLMAGWEAYAANQHSEAEAHLKEAARRHKTERWVGTWGNATVDLALLYCLIGDQKQALRTWEQAGAELELRGMPGQVLLTGRKVAPLLKLAIEHNLFADIARLGLSYFDTGTRPLSIPNSNETLTPREVEVLQLLGQGASNRTIAEQLTVTPRTAKAHVSNILQKLQVSSRTQAVVRARTLSLL